MVAVAERDTARGVRMWLRALGRVCPHCLRRFGTEDSGDGRFDIVSAALYFASPRPGPLNRSRGNKADNGVCSAPTER